MTRKKLIENPYRPGAGHSPPILAGREKERDHFRKLLRQEFTTENILITGLRGFGKTVLLNQMKQTAEAEDWLWVGNDLSESSALSEERLAIRILTDLSQSLAVVLAKAAGRSPNPSASQDLEAIDELESNTFASLKAKYERTPGLPSDKLKTVLGRIGSLLGEAKLRGIILAYDEAQCLSDHAQQNEFPMSMLVETVGALQKRDGITPCLLVLSGLPQVFDALTASRTYTERMFHVMRLDRLSRSETEAALHTPLEDLMPPLYCPKELLNKVASMTGGYPYLIQFFGKELVAALLNNGGVINEHDFPSPDVLDRLDAGLFAARWNKTTDKQRSFLRLVANRDTPVSPDFSAAEILASDRVGAQFDNAQANQMLLALCERGLIYRTRHGRYAFTVPMSETMILRRMKTEEELEASWEATPASPIDEIELSSFAEEEPPRGLRGWFRS